MCDMTVGGLCEWHVMANIGLKRLHLGFWGLRTICMHIKASLSWWVLTKNNFDWESTSTKYIATQGIFLLLKYFTSVLFIWVKAVSICLGRCDFLTAEQLTQLPGGQRAWFVKIHGWGKKNPSSSKPFKEHIEPLVSASLLLGWLTFYMEQNKLNTNVALLTNIQKYSKNRSRKVDFDDKIIIHSVYVHNHLHRNFRTQRCGLLKIFLWTTSWETPD